MMVLNNPLTRPYFLGGGWHCGGTLRFSWYCHGLRLVSSLKTRLETLVEVGLLCQKLEKLQTWIWYTKKVTWNAKKKRGKPKQKATKKWHPNGGTKKKHPNWRMGRFKNMTGSPRNELGYVRGSITRFLYWKWNHQRLIVIRKSDRQLHVELYSFH